MAGSVLCRMVSEQPKRFPHDSHLEGLIFDHSLQVNGQVIPVSGASTREGTHTLDSFNSRDLQVEFITASGSINPA